MQPPGQATGWSGARRCPALGLVSGPAHTSVQVRVSAVYWSAGV